ncbi:hypothetical protein EVJ58_g730 [Rhodofomes roseus]|uniref:Uncharacterized protein n=1 Tax=Rhodofomes roseus TaxID=34475 RepID=A0A4Y9Z4E2_9APHY|nr:hypothetical protein EVJ58_g730 [Rhodofomes roseus]
MVLNVILDATSTVNGVIIPIIYALQTSLLSHFYINLHKANKSMAGIPTDVSQVSDPRFARVVGTLAGSLAYGKPSFPEDGDVDGDWEMAANEYLADLPDVQEPATASDNKLHDDEAYAADHISIGHSFIESVPRVEFGVV